MTSEIAVRSGALEKFLEGIKEVECLAAMCVEETPGAADLPVIRERNEALCRGALILLCSHVEGFCENLVGNVFDFYCASTRKVSELPEKLKARLAGDAITQIGPATLDKTKLEAFRALKDMKILDETLTVAHDMLDHEKIVRGFSTPGSSEVKKLFAHVGIENIWTDVKRYFPDDTYLIGRLDSIECKRHPMAHGDASAKETSSDLSLEISDMKKLTEIIDSTVKNRLFELHGVLEPWAY